MDPENPPPIAEKIEYSIPDDSICISVKYNLSSDEKELLEREPLASVGFNAINWIREYLLDSKADIVASSVGLHLKGKNHQPHIHYHVIALNAVKPTNPSDHRRRWLNKKSNEGKDFGDLSIKYQKLDVSAPKYGFLSYPLKEGCCPKWALKSNDFMVLNNRKMTNEEYQFLKDVGVSIYEKQCGLRLRQDKCEERKQLALLTLYVLCDERKTEFASYKSMVKWLDVNYIVKLDITEYPDPKNYKTNTQKVAVKLGYLLYSDLCV